MLADTHWPSYDNLAEYDDYLNFKGAASSSAQGVLMLESTSKALVLPKVNHPVTSMKSTIAGTMCYDTVSKTIAVFDGVKWSFWK
ncbi:hypothetical protein HHL23_20615 [Chryseobacterium sp. RP-3-3]|uniref:Uncharacterized protein n=1 Tax=Chryseobacterium antibioticum TaxID=2728847 RepID=A0A7Y0ARI6_9FLAO|nr:hypothetical protein [Chryseobacterium antibioticum]NML72171.1 hypothetical protein [Chryseobacterium antibioticum]